MAGRSFVPIGSRGEWPKFSNGKRFPYMLWGSTFREASDKVIIDASSRIEAISIVALGRIEHSEFALASFGEPLALEKQIAELNAEAEELLTGAHTEPDWSGEFEEPFDNFKTISRQENNGLVVVAHTSNGTESSSFGDISPSASADSLIAMSDLLLNGAGVSTNPSTVQEAQTAA